MKQVPKNSNFFFILAFVLASILTQPALAQTPKKKCDTDNTLPTVPAMFVKPETSDRGIREFKAKKWSALGGVDQILLFYNINAFDSMLRYFHGLTVDAIRVYIGVYDKALFPQLENTYEKDNTLTIFFSPQYKTKILGFYWLPIDAKDFDPSKNRISYENAAKIVEKFIAPGSKHSKMYKLTKTIKTKPKSNYYNNIYNIDSICDICPDNDTKRHFSDTRSIVYTDVAFVKEIHEEIDYQDKIASTSNIPISGIRVYYAQHPYKNDRLFLQFTFTKKNANGDQIDFGIDEDKKFCHRPEPAYEVANLVPVASFDNGQMCPPNCAAKKE